MADGSAQLTLEELAALNDEIIQLTRAGVPLESGLRAFAGDGEGRANRAAEQLAARMESGQSLVAGIRADGKRYPALYATVVEAGLRAGRLPIALEAISDFSREFTELRRSLMQALLYPLITAIAAYALFVVFVTRAVNHIMAWQDLVGQQSGQFLIRLQWLADHIGLWVWIPPAVIIANLVLWAASGRAGIYNLSGLNSVILWIPGMRQIVACYRHCIFARLSAILLEQDVPLHDALILAAGGCGRELQQAATEFAAADEKGDRSDVNPRAVRGMRPLLRWILKRHQSGAVLVASLRSAASGYVERGRTTIRWIRFAAPIFFTLFVAGSLTALYTLSLFMPLADLMQQIAEGV